MPNSNTEDLSGMKFNKIDVIDFAYFKMLKNGKRRAYFNCMCDCGNKEIFTVSGASLKSGKVKSCGCLHKAAGIKRRKHNEYKIDDLNRQVFFYLKDVDYYFQMVNLFLCYQNLFQVNLYLVFQDSLLNMDLVN